MARLLESNIDKLLDLDKTVTLCLQDILESVEKGNFGEGKVVLAGSIVEGCATSKFFHPNPDRHEYEINLMNSSVSYPDNTLDLFQPVPDKTGFVRIHFNTSQFEYFPRELLNSKHFKNCGIQNWESVRFLSPKVMKKIATSVFVDDGDKMTPLENIAGLLLGVSIEKVDSDWVSFAGRGGGHATQLGKRSYKLTFQGKTEDEDSGGKNACGKAAGGKNEGGATAGVKSGEKEDEGAEIIISAKFEGSIRLDFWPDEAVEWISRNGKWPDQSIRRVVSQTGCFVVPESSKNGDNDTEWKLCFANAERVLFDLLTTNQMRAYFLFKAIFYKYIVPIKLCETCCEKHSDENNREHWTAIMVQSKKCAECKHSKEQLHSYLAKTVLFWALEKSGNSDPVWADGQIAHGTALLLQTLQAMIRERNLPNYFMRDMNLLDGIPDIVLELVAMKLKNLQENVSVSIQSNLPEVHDRVSVLQKPFGTLQQVAKVWKWGSGLAENVEMFKNMGNALKDKMGFLGNIGYMAGLLNNLQGLGNMKFW